MHFGKNKLQRLGAQWFGKKRLGDYLSDAEQLASVQKDPIFIKHIRRPSLAVQLAAVEKDGSLIRHIIDPDVQTQLKAICNPAGIGFLPYATMNGLLNPEKMCRACPGLGNIIMSLSDMGLLDMERKADMILAAEMVKRVVEGTNPAQGHVTLPDDLDQPTP